MDRRKSGVGGFGLLKKLLTVKENEATEGGASDQKATSGNPASGSGSGGSVNPWRRLSKAGGDTGLNPGNAGSGGKSKWGDVTKRRASALLLGEKIAENTRRF